MVMQPILLTNLLANDLGQIQAEMSVYIILLVNLLVIFINLKLKTYMKKTLLIAVISLILVSCVLDKVEKPFIIYSKSHFEEGKCIYYYTTKNNRYGDFIEIDTKYSIGDTIK